MSEMWELTDSRPTRLPSPDRRYTTVSNGAFEHHEGEISRSDLHAWSIYRQNLNSDFTDSALGSDSRSPLPYGNFQLRETTVQSIMRNPRLGPKSELGGNMSSYLKFGLPRVLPPKGGRDGVSSGYDSGEERGMNRSRSRNTERMGMGSTTALSQIQQMRAKSETDLREGMISNRFRKGGGAHSVANSIGHLSNANTNFPPHAQQVQQMREMRSNMRSSNSTHGAQSVISGRGGGGGTLTSMHTSNQSNRFRNGTTNEAAIFSTPHLQVRSLCYEVNDDKTKSKKRLMLDSVSFDIRGGEMMALMATSEREGTILLETLSGRRSSSSRISGDFILNGNPLSISRLGSRAALVRPDYRLHPHLTVTQTLQFYNTFKKLHDSSHAPTAPYSQRIKEVLEDLGLTSVRHSLVSNLTNSERQRLSVACQLLLNTDIILLDQPTRGMDIFDTFFLVTFLQEWTSSSTHPRVTIMTIHPPTFEIFSIFSKVSLLSRGRVMFYGHRTEMLPYFAFIEYPCPGFKNPSDYYIDLVTLDELSPEALLESTQRIESLADSWRRRQESLSEVGPPNNLPPRVKGANGGFFGEVLGIWKYELVYSFPWNLINWILFMLVASALSVLIGAIYWNVRLSTPQDVLSAYDRMGFLWTVLVILPHPILLLLIARDKRSTEFVTRDVEEELYSKASYIIAKTLIEMPFCVSIFIAYILPAYVMAGVSYTNNDDSNSDFINLFNYIGYTILYLYTLRCLTFTLSLFFSTKRKTLSVSLISLFQLIVLLSAAYTISLRDVGQWAEWTQYVSPTAWVFKPLAQLEFNNSPAFDICNNPIIQKGGVMQQISCGLKDGPSVLSHYALNTAHPVFLPILILIGFILIAQLCYIITFIVKRLGLTLPGPQKP